MIPFSCSATSGSNAPDELAASAWADDINAATGSTAALTEPLNSCVAILEPATGVQPAGHIARAAGMAWA
jgi:hypothetical protein